MRGAPALGLALALALVPPASVRAERIEGAARARALLARGTALFADGAFARAVEVLGQARAAAAGDRALRARIALQLGFSYFAQNDKKRSTHAFRAALTDDPSLRVDPDRHKPSLVATFEAVRRILVGVLQVSVDQPLAEVSIDGGPALRAPTRLALRAGAHRVTIAVGARRHRRTVTVAAGQTTRLDIVLGDGPAPGVGTQTATMGAVSHDRRASRAGGPGAAAAPEVGRDGGPGDRRGGRLWTWIVGATALAAAAVAVGVGLSARADHQRACDLLADPGAVCEARLELRRAEDRARYAELSDRVALKQGVTNAAWISAAVLAAAASVLFFVERPRAASPATAAARLSPIGGALEPGGGVRVLWQRAF